MRSATILLLLSFFLCLKAESQTEKSSENLKQQIDIMGQAFINADYKTFTTYTYPTIISGMGGSQQMIKTLKSVLDAMGNKGIKFNKISFGEPSEIIKYHMELQATIAQHIELSTPQGRFLATSTMLAFSKDNGNHWTFADASNKDSTTLKKMIPNLSPSIKIPPMEPPVKYPD